MIEFETSNNKKYYVEIIYNSAIYIKQSEICYFIEFYYLIQKFFFLKLALAL